MKKLFYPALCVALAAGFVSCSNDDDKEEPVTPPAEVVENHSAYVLCQGVYGLQMDGTLDYINLKEKTVDNSVFQKANQRTLGNTPQAGIVYGSKIYVGVYESNTIEVMDGKTFSSLHQISLSENEGQNPRSMVAKDGKIYISMYNGYVSRLDTITMKIDANVKVGPNPENIAICGDYLYVPNSDGMNWPDYGTTASKIRLSDFTVASTLEVPLNPCQFLSNGTDLFLLSKGNYDDIASAVYKISADGKYTKIAEATIAAIYNDKVYLIDAPWYASEFKYQVYDIASDSLSDMLADSGVDSPVAVGVNPTDGTIVITSYVLDGGYAGYTLPGYAVTYDAQGNRLNKYDVGVGPALIFF